jgi:membrane carboxypeptidase/penicillin-binding protein PbpC
MGGADERRSARTSDPIFASPVRRHHAHYEIDPVLPPSQQMVEFTAAVASDVEWFVNNERILPQHDGRFFWQLAPGKWNIRAVTRIGTAEETVTVE